jgi:hypothetical protein
MPRRIEMGDLVLRCQQRADKVGDDHIGGTDPAEWKRLVSEVWSADVFQVVANTGLRYFEYTATLTTTGAAYVDEPAAIAQTVRLDYVDPSGLRIEVQEINSQEENIFAGQTGTARFYALVDDRFYLYPTPPSGQTYELLYVPQAPDLSTYADDDIVDLVNADGEACVIWGVAALAKIKAQQDASFHFQRQEKFRNQLQGWAAERAISQGRRQHAADEYAERFGWDEGDWR